MTVLAIVMSLVVMFPPPSGAAFAKSSSIHFSNIPSVETHICAMTLPATLFCRARQGVRNIAAERFPLGGMIKMMTAAGALLAMVHRTPAPQTEYSVRQKEILREVAGSLISQFTPTLQGYETKLADYVGIITSPPQGLLNEGLLTAALIVYGLFFAHRLYVFASEIRKGSLTLYQAKRRARSLFWLTMIFFGLPLLGPQKVAPVAFYNPGTKQLALAPDRFQTEEGFRFAAALGMFRLFGKSGLGVFEQDVSWAYTYATLQVLDRHGPQSISRALEEIARMNPVIYGSAQRNIDAFQYGLRLATMKNPQAREQGVIAEAKRRHRREAVPTNTPPLFEARSQSWIGIAQAGALTNKEQDKPQRNATLYWRAKGLSPEEAENRVKLNRAAHDVRPAGVILRGLAPSPEPVILATVFALLAFLSGRVASYEIRWMIKHYTSLTLTPRHRRMLNFAMGQGSVAFAVAYLYGSAWWWTGLQTILWVLGTYALLIVLEFLFLIKDGDDQPVSHFLPWKQKTALISA